MRSRSSDLAGKVVVVTGTSAGVGRATARAFARRGAHVAALARATPGLDAVVAEIEREGVRGIGCPVDVADAEQVEAAADRVENEPFGDEAKGRSWQWRATRHRRVLLGAAGAVTVGALTTALGRR